MTERNELDDAIQRAGEEADRMYGTPASLDPAEVVNEVFRRARESASSSPVVLPQQRTIIAMCIEDALTQSAAVTAVLRASMLDLVAQALFSSGVTSDLRDPFIDLDDGVVVLVHSTEGGTETRMVTRFLPLLSGLLDKHNAVSQYPLRLRVAFHTGDVGFDTHGAFGVDLDLACFLVDAPQLKARLRASSASFAVAPSNRFADLAIPEWAKGPEEAGGSWVDQVS